MRKLVLLSALALFPVTGCSGDDDGDKSPTTPATPGTPTPGPTTPSEKVPEDYREFWWTRGAVAGRQNLVVAELTGTDNATLRYVSVTQPVTEGSGWEHLFRVPEGPHGARLATLTLNRTVYTEAAATITQRLDEVGGRARLVKPVAEDLDLGNGQVVDVTVIGAVLLSVPAQATTEQREPALNTLAFAHAAAVQAAKEAPNDESAYRTKFDEVLLSVGWVQSSATNYTGTWSIPLVQGIADKANARVLFEKLNLLEAPVL